MTKIELLLLTSVYDTSTVRSISNRWVIFFSRAEVNSRYRKSSSNCNQKKSQV